MAKITSFTVFVWTTLVVYSILSGFFLSFAMTGNPISTQTYPFPGTLGGILNSTSFIYQETHNITAAGWPTQTYVSYTTFEPDKRLGWNQEYFWLPARFLMMRYGTWLIFGTWMVEPWYYYNSTLYPGGWLDPSVVISEWDSSTNSSNFIVDLGTAYEADVYIQPYTNGTHFLYGGNFTTTEAISWSLGNGTVTISVGSDYLSYGEFNIDNFVGAVVNVITFQSFSGAPTFIVWIIGGIWWILLALGVGKLLIG